MADPVEIRFDFTGGWQKFNVPAGTSSIRVTLHGAGGGGSGAGNGGRLRGKLRVRGKDDLYILVGEHGIFNGTQNAGNQTTGGGGPGGNGGSSTRNGGGSGGGSSEIRLNGTGGKILAVAGGGGGRSGDGGNGGAGGGGAKGQDGFRAGGSSANVATGGTQTKGGNGGTVPSNPGFNGENASDNVSARGGGGGHSSDNKCHGGGGGGGGYHAGGGGQAGKAGVFNGGGGAGGSSFRDELHDVDVDDSAGPAANTHGHVIFEYDPDGDPNPSIPSEVSVNGVAESAEMATRSSTVKIGAKITDTINAALDGDLHIYLTLARWIDPGKPGQIITDVGRIEMRGTPVNDTVFIPPGGTASVAGYSTVSIGGLQPNTLYKGRLYSQDNRGQWSDGYVSISFWTNRPPDPPALTAPANSTEFDSDDTLGFSWTYSDPDQDTGEPETQSGTSFRYRLAATLKDPPGAWVTSTFGGATSTSFPAANLTPGRWYEWQVAVADSHGAWSPYSVTRSFYINAIALPPTLLSPANEEAIYAAENNVFSWRFNTQISDETQVTADIRYRAVGASTWETLTGTTGEPGSDGRWLILAETFVTDTRYEWQARVHTSNSTISLWSGSSYFWATRLPGLTPDIVPIDVTRMQEALGQYDNRVYVYLRGGEIPVAEISPIFDVQWDRKRDDFGTCTIHVNEWDPETRDMLRSLKPWAHELVVYRNGKRCWEGPITRISGTRESLEIEARDVMAYVYRRIMRQGYNDSYQVIAGQQVGLHTVVYRAQRIITNALIYDDPNVLPYLTPIHNPGDAIQSRIALPYTRTAWEEVDDLAAHAGLDYSISGRRIILNDTHRPIGKLPELGDGDFSTPPIVTVYGMTFATDFGVTNNNGYYGLAVRHDETLPETGHIEQLASEYGESDASGANTEDMTPEEIAALIATLNAQAERNIANRYPMPVVVRVADNSTLDPNINLGINQLIPGVWAPLRATQGIVQASQWQKLDSVTVRQDAAGEKISVVFSPAPNGGQDPDGDLEEGT